MQDGKKATMVILRLSLTTGGGVMSYNVDFYPASRHEPLHRQKRLVVLRWYHIMKTWEKKASLMTASAVAIGYMVIHAKTLRGALTRR